MKSDVMRTGRRTSATNSFNESAFDPVSRLAHPYIWIGESQGMEKGVMADRGIDFFSTPSAKLRRYFSLRSLWIPFGIGF